MSLYYGEAQLENYQNRQLQRVINEAYFGRTAGIMEVFDAFCEFRAKFKNGRKIMRGDIHAANSPEIRALRDAIQKEFGYETVSIMIDQSSQFNAGCFVYSIGHNPEKLQITKNGYRYKDGSQMSLLMYFNAGYIFNDELDDEAAFAILLHEIGHNFQNSSNPTLYTLRGVNILTKVMRLILSATNVDVINTFRNAESIILDSVLFNRLYAKINNLVVMDSKYIAILDSALSFYVSLLDDVKNIALTIIRLPTMPINVLCRGLIRLSNLILNPIGSYSGYLGERFADGFAASYGFGNDLAMQMIKTSSITASNPVINTIDKIPLIGHIYSAMMLPGEILMSFGDCHPEHATRAYSIIKDLKADLKDPGLDPKLKKQLKAEIDELENNIEGYFAESKRIDNPMICRIAWDNFVYHKANGGIKFKLSELGHGEDGFRGETNRWANKYRTESYSYVDSVDIV